MTANAAADAARAWFAARDLPQPYVPAALAAALVARGDDHFSTRETQPPSAQWLPDWLDELDAGGVAPYAVIAAEGRGSSRHAVHVFVAIGPLAVLIQAPWGGAFGPEHLMRQGMAAAFARVEPLLRAAEARADEDRAFVLVISGFERSGWRKIGREKWHREPDHIDGLARRLGV